MQRDSCIEGFIATGSQQITALRKTSSTLWNGTGEPGRRRLRLADWPARLIQAILAIGAHGFLSLHRTLLAQALLAMAAVLGLGLAADCLRYWVVAEAAEDLEAVAIAGLVQAKTLVVEDKEDSAAWEAVA